MGCASHVDKYIVGVAGGTASGKTTVVSKIMDSFCNIQVNGKIQILCISLDDFYKNLNEYDDPYNYNFDSPNAIDIDEAYFVINKFINGEEILIPTYDFSTHSRSHGIRYELNPFADRVIVIVEGIHSLDSRLCKLYNKKIWIESDSDVRLSRRISRDMYERGRTKEIILNQWNTFAQPTFLQYESGYKSIADTIINNDKPICDNDINLLCNEFLGI